jgi:hypothetical protein
VVVSYFLLRFGCIYQKSIHSKSASEEGALAALGGSYGSLPLKPDLLLDLF